MSREQSNVDKGEVAQTDAEQSGELLNQADGLIDESSSNVDADSIEQQLATAQVTIKEYWEQIMRLRAEIENNRKRAERDVENAHKYSIKNFVENILPVVDSMELGQTAAEAENATLDSIREGTSLTMGMLMQVLEKNGLEQIDPAGEKFDPEKHQAISIAEIAGAESNSVVEVMQKGFSLNERLVRPAMVVVAK